MKKVLIISYYWPPAGGISVLRSLKIAKYLNRLEWEPIIFTAKDAQYPYFDKSNILDIPEGITIIKRPIFEPFNIFKRITGRGKDDTLNNILHVRDKKLGILDKLGIWIRGNFFIPDARSLWIKPSTRFLIKYLKKNPVDAIFTDGPPHTNTVIALNIKKVLNIPWLADFQDPWTQVDYYKLFKISNWAHKKHLKLEQEVFKYADKITTVSNSWKSDLEKIGARDVGVVYWGFDEDDFSEIHQDLDKSFTITHIGLMGFDRNPKTLFKVLSELKSELPQFGEKLRFQLVGQLDYEIISTLKEYKLEDSITNFGMIKRESVLQKIVNSQLLLLLLNQADNIKGRLPGKMFEYLAAKRPILCMGSPESDAAKILKTSQSGSCFEYDDAVKIKKYLVISFNLFLDNELNNNVVSNNKYSVINQVKKIGSILDSITNSSSAGVPDN